VFASARPGRVMRADGGHFVNVEKAWSHVRQAAELEGVRLHDLRHSFASIGAAGGMSLPILGGLLGHRHAGTTARYAHLGHDPLQVAAESISTAIAGALDGKQGAEVVEMPSRGSGKFK
jgi:integrase